MTENEIKNALEYCIFDDCESCPHYEETACTENLLQETLDLLEEKDKKIDELNIELKAMRGAANSYKTENQQLQSDVIIAKQEYKHIKQLWEADRTKAKEAINKYITKHNELIAKEDEIKTEAAEAFCKFLIDRSEGGVIVANDLPNLVIEWGKVK